MSVNSGFLCIAAVRKFPNRPDADVAMNPLPFDQHRILTAQEAAAYLGGLNTRTLVRWAREGYLPAIPIGDGKRRLWRFLQTDLEQWMLARRQGGQNAA